MAQGESKKEMLGLFAVTGWNIWTMRNKWFFKQDWKMETKIIEEALEEFNTFLQATKKDEP